MSSRPWIEMLYGSAQPYDLMADEFTVTYSVFWLADHGASDMATSVPDGAIKGNGKSVGVPTASQETDVAIALSVWESPREAERGDFLGESTVTASSREVGFRNVEGREPGPVMVLPEEGTYVVRVWRLEGSGPELYDVRMWLCPTVPTSEQVRHSGGRKLHP